MESKIKKKTDKTKTKTKKKHESQDEKKNSVQVTLFNVLPFLIERVAKIDRDIDELKKTVDAIGLLLASHSIKKD